MVKFILESNHEREFTVRREVLNHNRLQESVDLITIDYLDTSIARHTRERCRTEEIKVGRIA